MALSNRSIAVKLGANASEITQLAPLRANARVTRRPKHSFRLKTRPFVIQPMMIAPVLPGETMQQLLLQARAATDPLKDKLGGWWHEYYFFYVRHRSLDIGEDLVNMHVEGASIAAHNSGAAVATYHMGGQVDFVYECLKTVTHWYFRDSDEAWNAPNSTISIGGRTMPLAKASDRLWWDSLKLADQIPDMDSNLPGVYPIQLPDHLAEWQDAYNQWTWMRENKFTEATFEDYLRTFGIRANAATREDELKPELIRYVRDWTYPSNTINPTDGSAASSAVWAIAERADKDRFFREPGFVFGVCITRPKVYYRGQLGHVAATWDTAMEWLPALTREDPYMSLTEKARTAGPIAGVPHAGDATYWYDQRDLMIHGDQFVNFTLSDTDYNSVGLPRNGGAGVLIKEYVQSTDMNGFFSSEANNLVRIDGRVDLHIKGHQRDHT